MKHSWYLFRRTEKLLIRRPFLRKLLHELFSRYDTLFNQQLRRCICLREA